MPTTKQVRYHYGRIMKLHRKLQRALYDAHDAKVIQYTGWTGVAPCEAHDETRSRIKATCEKQLAVAMSNEILNTNYKY
jgi:hypothetical protein